MNHLDFYKTTPSTSACGHRHARAVEVIDKVRANTILSAKHCAGAAVAGAAAAAAVTDHMVLSMQAAWQQSLLRYSLLRKSVLLQKIGDTMVDSVLSENIPVLTEQEKFNETITSSIKRLEASITGQLSMHLPMMLCLHTAQLQP